MLITIYLDDILIQASTCDEALLQGQIAALVLMALGFSINWKKSCFTPSQQITHLGFCQRIFWVLMTTDSNPLYNPPLSKSDDDANEREEVLIHEHLFDSSNIGVETGSNKDNSKIDETNITGLTKRLGEVDYTEVEST